MGGGTDGGEVCPVTNLPSVVADAPKACRTLAATASWHVYSANEVTWTPVPFLLAAHFW